jgi:hypothetical protein
VGAGCVLETVPGLRASWACGEWLGAGCLGGGSFVGVGSTVGAVGLGAGGVGVGWVPETVPGLVGSGWLVGPGWLLGPGSGTVGAGSGMTAAGSGMTGAGSPLAAGVASIVVPAPVAAGVDTVVLESLAEMMRSVVTGAVVVPAGSLTAGGASVPAATALIAAGTSGAVTTQAHTKVRTAARDPRPNADAQECRARSGPSPLERQHTSLSGAGTEAGPPSA